MPESLTTTTTAGEEEYQLRDLVDAVRDNNAAESAIIDDEDSESDASDSTLGSSLSNQEDFNPVQLDESHHIIQATNNRQGNPKLRADSTTSTIRRTASGRRHFSSISRTTSAKSERSNLSTRDQVELNKDLTRQLSIVDAIFYNESANSIRRRTSTATSTGAGGPSVHEVPSLEQLQEERYDAEDQPIDRAASNVEKIFTNKSTGQLDLPPDGGYGWVCVACVTVIQACTWGANAGYGIFLEYYLSNNVFANASSYDYALIAGLIVFSGQFCAPFAMILMKMIGFKLTMSIACTTHCLGYILASFATKIWHLYVCQGVIVGVSYSFLFVPASTVIPTWFLKKRAIASGVSYGGTGLGGVIYSVSVNATIKKTGNQRWALRMVGITTFFVIAISIIFIKQRTPFKREKFSLKNLSNNTKLMFSKRVLLKKPLWYVTFWFALCIIGYNLVLFSYATYATTIGLSSSQASTLTALINAAQALGRPMMGFVSDRWVGRINYTLCLDLFLTIMILAFWINAKTFISLLFCGLLIGATIGVGNVMNLVMIADSFPIEDFISAWSILNMGIGFFSLPVEVIALALRDYSISNPFLYTQIFGGLLFLISMVILAPQREWAVRNSIKKKRDQLKRELRDLEPLGKDIHNIHVEGITTDLHERLAMTEGLLKENPRTYFKRMFHPMKI